MEGGRRFLLGWNRSGFTRSEERKEGRKMSSTLIRRLKTFSPSSMSLVWIQRRVWPVPCRRESFWLIFLDCRGPTKRGCSKVPLHKTDEERLTLTGTGCKREVVRATQTKNIYRRPSSTFPVGLSVVVFILP